MDLALNYACSCFHYSNPVGTVIVVLMMNVIRGLMNPEGYRKKLNIRTERFVPISLEMIFWFVLQRFGEGVV